MFCCNTHKLISQWSESFPYDFRDEKMMKTFRSICHFCVNNNASLRNDVGETLQSLMRKLQQVHEYENNLSQINSEALEQMQCPTTTDICALCPEVDILTNQLTHIELQRLHFIGPNEFVESFAKSSPKIENPLMNNLKTRNLEAYVEWFNRLSYLVATQVCMQLRRKQRVKMIEYFIEVGKQCLRSGNFNSMMAIVAGLNMSSVRRLRKTWNRVNPEDLLALEKTMDPSSNFSNYRSMIRDAIGSDNDNNQVTIPFFSLLIKDIYFLNEACVGTKTDGNINFSKFWQLAKQITEFLSYKEAICTFDKHPTIVNYLLTSPVFSETGLALASFECESPESSGEKQRYSQLKTMLKQGVKT